MSFKTLSWGGDSGQLDVGFGKDGTVSYVTLWTRMTLWYDWQWRLQEHVPRLVNPPSPIVWEKTTQRPTG